MNAFKRHFFALPKHLYRVTVVTVTLLLVIWFALQAFALRDLEQYRPKLITLFHDSTGLNVSIGVIDHAPWGIQPGVLLKSVVVYADTPSTPLLVLPSVEARLSLFNLFRGRLDFSHLTVTIEHVSVLRDKNGQWFLASLPVPKNDTKKNPFLNWLVEQGHCELHISQLILDDQLTQQPVHGFSQVSLFLDNSGSRHHVTGQLTPDAYFGAPLHFSGDVYGGQTDDLSAWQGKVHWQTQRLNLTAFTPWIPALQALNSGYGSVEGDLLIHDHLSLGFEGNVDLHALTGKLPNSLSGFNVHEMIGQIGIDQLGDALSVSTKELVVKGQSSLQLSHPLTLQIVLGDSLGAINANQLSMNDLHNNVEQLPLTDQQRQFWYKLGLQGELSQLEVHWTGPLSQPQSYHGAVDLNHFSANPYDPLPAIHNFSGHLEVADNGGRLKGSGESLTLNFPQQFARPLFVDHYSFDSNWIRNGDKNYSINLNQVNLTNADFSGEFSGNLALTDQGVGQSQLHGNLQRADLTAIWRYMPLTVNQSARDWLKQGFTKGEVKEVSFQVAGDLQRFPFANDEGGVFRVNAKIMNAEVNFNPAWPVIKQVAGDFYMKGGALGFNATSASIANNTIKQVSVTIPDLVHSNEILEVDGQTQSTVKDTLFFIQNSPVRNYIRHVTDNMTGSGNGTLSLKLAIPLLHPIDATIKGDYQFVDAGLDDGEKGIPPINNINGHLFFTESEVSSQPLKAMILGGQAELVFKTDPQHQTILAAHGQADAAALYSVYTNPILKNVSGQSSWQGLFKFGEKQTDLLLDSQVLLANEPVTLHLSTRRDGLVDLALKGYTSPKALTALFPNPLLRVLDSGVDWNGHVLLSKKHDDVSFSMAALVLKKPVYMTVKGSLSQLLVAEMNGKTDMADLGRLDMANINEFAHGAFNWHAHFEKRPEKTSITLTSDLKGVSISGPVPFAKNVTQVVPFTVVVQPIDSGNTLMTLNMDSWFGMKVYYASNQKGDYQAVRGVFNLGGPYLGAVNPGFALTGRMEQVNLDDIQSFWNAHNTKSDRPSVTNQVSKNGTKNTFFGPIEQVNLNLSKVIWKKRLWTSHVITADWQNPQWNIHIKGDQINGSILWNKTNQGSIKGNFTQLIVPLVINKDNPETKDKSPRPKKKLPTDLAKPEDLQHMPNIDLTADHCVLGKKTFSHLEFLAINKNQSWQIDHLLAQNEGGEIKGNGQWVVVNDDQTKTSFKLGIDAKNLGRFSSLLGYDKLIARGDGNINADINWLGGPMDYDFDFLSGVMSIELHDGQFSKVDPGGAGRLIGLLSLQSLPRRMTLDFHDFFSQGFAFDTVKGSFDIKMGVLHTPDFEMVGPAASVKLTGLIDVPDETSDLVAKVDPAVGGDISLASTLIGGPVVGAATYLVQKILRNPLDKVLSYQYRIRGDWDNPEIESVTDSTNSSVQ